MKFNTLPDYLANIRTILVWQAYEKAEDPIYVLENNAPLDVLVSSSILLSRLELSDTKFYEP